jgi:aspartyl protease family protein
MVRLCVLILFAAALAASILPGGRPADAPRSNQTVQALGEPAPQAVQWSQSVTGEGLRLSRQPDGHFYADTVINGATVHMLVDTGASAIALSREDARRAGIGISIGMPAIVGEGAGGAVKGEFVTLARISLGGESAEDVPAVVLDGGGQSLLGQSFLSKFASVEIHGDTMVLR